jgi:hypothetical protein
VKTSPHPQNYGDPETFARDVELEGPVEVEFNPGIAGRLPTKSSAGGVLLRDRQGRVLFVVPRYKSVFDLPVEPQTTTSPRRPRASARWRKN